MKHTKFALALLFVAGLSACIGGSNTTNIFTNSNKSEEMALGSDECFFGGVKVMSGSDAEASSSVNCNANPLNGSTLPYAVMRSDIVNGARPGSFMEVRNGGFGSDMVAHPTEPARFYALTDRGPNVNFTGAQGKGKKFPTPGFTPRIGLFELQANGDVKKIKDILLKRPDGFPVTGLPNSAPLGGTGEIPYDADGNLIVVDMDLPFNASTNPLKLDDYGLDGEGLVALSDGSFWVSDEYGPHIVHFSADGIEIGRINAFAADDRTTFTLPAEFANRRANRGMEGLTVTPDESTLVGIMQSTMYNPGVAVKVNDIVRIVTINLADGAIGQYLYKQEKKQNSQSGIVALSRTEFVVIERDGLFYNDDDSAMKHLYKIDVSNATDLETLAAVGNITQNDALGLLIDGKTLEEVTLEPNGWSTIANAGIETTRKTLLVDLVARTSYPHDKLEGMWLINNSTIGVLNDDDFATWASNGVIEQKYLDAEQKVIDSSRLYIVEGIKGISVD